MSVRVLVYGFGNPGRLDDGLGPLLATSIGELGLEGVSVETAYQLQVEDAERIASFDAVVFADAHKTCPPPFELRELEPRSGAEFSTHSMAPDAILALAHDVFGSNVAGFLLGIRGEEFDDFGERLSPAAQEHLASAVNHLEALLRDQLLMGGPVTSRSDREIS